MENQNGMYGIPQAGKIVNDKLKILTRNSYCKSDYDILIFTKHKGLSHISPRAINALAQGILSHSLIRDSIPHRTQYIWPIFDTRQHP